MAGATEKAEILSIHVLIAELFILSIYQANTKRRLFMQNAVDDGTAIFNTDLKRDFRVALIKYLQGLIKKRTNNMAGD